SSGHSSCCRKTVVCPERAWRWNNEIRGQHETHNRKNTVGRIDPAALCRVRDRASEQYQSITWGSIDGCLDERAGGWQPGLDRAAVCHCCRKGAREPKIA